ncbi:MAG TPA: hypothetical protein VGC76_15845 [Pyrinomonadaceae bacterium]|jgi:hypothetical protein
MFSIDNFIEIQVVGFLFLLSISPLLNLFTPAFRTQEGFCPLFDNVSDKSAKAILILVLAFAVGIAANRLFDETFEKLGIEGSDEYSAPLEKWAQDKPGKMKELKLAEYYVSDNSETSAHYFERHKLFMRVLRGGAVAALLLVLMMAIYVLVWVRVRKKDILCSRYTLAHFGVAFLFFLMFFYAYKIEAHHYYKRVYDMYTDFTFEKK